MPRLTPHIDLRKILPIIALYVLCMSKSHGQIALGTWTIGGTGRFDFDHFENSLTPASPLVNLFNTNFFSDTTAQEIEVLKWNLVPQVGYFVNDRWLLSGVLGYQFEQIKFITENDQAKIFLVNVGVFLRRYIILDEEGKGGLTATMSVLFKFGDTDLEINGVEEDGPAVTTFSPFIDIGFFYFVTSDFALEANWFVLGYNVVQNNDTSADRFRFNTGIDLNDLSIGARWYLYR